MPLLLAVTFSTPTFVLFLGRFHPTFVHLPIGFLLMAALFEIFSRRARFAVLQAALPFTLFFAAISSIIAAALGYCLSLEAGYATELLARHQWSALALTVSIVALFLVKVKPEIVPAPWRARVYTGNFMLACALLVFAGHQGGALTHGEDYLTFYWSRDTRTAARGLVYHDFIQPLLQARCVSCHSAEKRKGDLVLENAEGVQRGGKHGAIILGGNVAESELLRRITLPAEHEERMPPAGKEALRAEEIALLQRWIQAGAAFDLPVAQFALPAGLANGSAEALVVNVPPADTSALGALRRSGLIATPIAQGQNFLQASAMNTAATFTDEQLALLHPLAEQLAGLDLQNTKISDAGLAQIARCRNLVRLRLENTAVTDAGLTHLQNLSRLEYLNLYNTRVTDAGLRQLAGLPKLKSLYLWQTQASAAGAAELQKSLPGVKINLGTTLATIDTSVMQLAPPSISFTNSFIFQPETVRLESGLREVDIHYTLDGSAPTKASPRYTKPLIIGTTTTLKAITTKSGWRASTTAVAEFFQLGHRFASIQLQTPPHARYPGSGPKTLIDAKKASNNFDDGMWLGFEQEDIEATLDLGASIPLHRLGVSCLENMNSWIFFPRAVEFFVSPDGVQYQRVGGVQQELPQRETELATRIFTLRVENVTARFVKVSVRNIGLCPKWHKGAGGKAWLFADEIVVE